MSSSCRVLVLMIEMMMMMMTLRRWWRKVEVTLPAGIAVYQVR
jgi:hypothetical protein